MHGRSGIELRILYKALSIDDLSEFKLDLLLKNMKRCLGFDVRGDG